MKDGLQRQVDAGVLKLCECGCGEIVPKVGSRYVAKHSRRASSRRNRKEPRTGLTLKQQRWINKSLAGAEAWRLSIRTRLLDNARCLYRWAHERGWFFKYDVKVADVLETEWLWMTNSARWKRMMRFMVKKELIECRKVKLYGTHGLMIKQYRMRGEYDREFADG